MKPLSVILALFGLLTVVQPARQLDLPGALLGIVVLLCAVAIQCPEIGRLSHASWRTALA